MSCIYPYVSTGLKLTHEPTRVNNASVYKRLSDERGKLATRETSTLYGTDFKLKATDMLCSDIL